MRENIALDIPYPKIEKTIPHFLTIDEYNRILQYFFKKATDFSGLRNLVIIMMLGLLGLRLGSILSLNIEDIDLETGLLQIIDKGRKGRTLIINGAGGSKTTYQHMIKNMFTLKPWPKIGKNNSILSC